MSARTWRRLLALTVAALVGYVFRLTDQAYGPVPFLVIALVLLSGWFSGYGWGWAVHSAATAEANRARDIAERDYDDVEAELVRTIEDRDNLAARIAELEDGGRFVARSVLAHPSVRSKVSRLPRQDGAR